MKFKSILGWSALTSAAALAPLSVSAQQAQNVPRVMPPPLPPPPKIPIPRQGIFVFSYIVETDGRVSDCRIVEVSGDLPGSSVVGLTPCNLQFAEPYRDQTGAPVRKRVTFREEVIWEELP